MRARPRKRCFSYSFFANNSCHVSNAASNDRNRRKKTQHMNFLPICRTRKWLFNTTVYSYFTLGAIPGRPKYFSRCPRVPECNRWRPRTVDQDGCCFRVIIIVNRWVLILLLKQSNTFSSCVQRKSCKTYNINVTHVVGHNCVRRVRYCLSVFEFGYSRSMRLDDFMNIVVVHTSPLSRE
jgi:hypothetical protein